MRPGAGPPRGPLRLHALHVFAEPLPLRAVAEPLDEPIHAPLQSIGRETGREKGVGSSIRDDVEADVQTLRSGSVVQLDDLIYVRPVGLPEGLDVGVLHRDTVRPADLDDLLGRLQCRLARTAHVAREDAPRGFERLGHCYELIGRGIHAWSVHQARGEPESSLLHALAARAPASASVCSSLGAPAAKPITAMRTPPCEVSGTTLKPTPRSDSASRYSPRLVQSKQKPSDWKNVV